MHVFAARGAGGQHTRETISTYRLQQLVIGNTVLLHPWGRGILAELLMNLNTFKKVKLEI